VELGNYSFFQAIQHVVTGQPPSERADRQSFCERIAFVNLIQESMDKPTDPPSGEQWARAWKCFPEIILQTMPDVIFCFTRRGWNAQGSQYPHQLLKDIRNDLRPDCALLYDMSRLRDGYYIVAGGFNHPADRGGFNPSNWHPYAQRILDAAPAFYDGPWRSEWVASATRIHQDRPQACRSGRLCRPSAAVGGPHHA
jgi:hypothetical protein